MKETEKIHTASTDGMPSNKNLVEEVERVLMEEHETKYRDISVKSFSLFFFWTIRIPKHSYAQNKSLV